MEASKFRMLATHVIDISYRTLAARCAYSLSGGVCTGCVVVCKMVKMCNCLNLKACNHGNI